MSFFILLSLTAWLMPVWTECAAALLSFRYPSLVDNYAEPLLRCFDTVSRTPYWCFSIALKVILSLSDRHKIFTSDCLWIKLKFVKMQFLVNRYHYDNNKQKNFESIKSEFRLIQTCYEKSDTRNLKCGVK